MATCGFSLRKGAMVVDPMVKLFDIRTMKSLPPLPFPVGPSLLKFHPKLSGTILAASQSGQFQICDVANQSSNVSFFQADISGFLSAVDFSSSGEILALGDSAGTISLWIEQDEPKVNSYSRATEQADPLAPAPAVKILDDSPLNLIGMPYYTTPLLSATWPTSLKHAVGQPSPKIPPEVMANVKMIDFVGYAPNPGTFRRNQNLALSRKARRIDQDGPKFRSEQEREKFFGQQKRRNSRSQTASSDDAVETTKNGNVVAKHYRRVEIKYSKFGVEDFDFGFFNKTLYGGLETHIINSYCNAMLQVLFFNRPLREIAKAHIKTKCPKEFCLCCELGFLFRMLEDARGANCQATNFLRAFSNIPQANALGLFEPDLSAAGISYSALIQNFNRFILEQIHQEYGPDSTIALIRDLPDTLQPPKSVLQQLFGLPIQSTSRCHACETEIGRDSIPFVLDLTYPRKATSLKSSSATAKEAPPSRPRFVEILEQSIDRESFTKAWCQTCNRYQPTSQTKHLKYPPNVLSINANASNEEDLHHYFTDDEPFLPLRIALMIKDKKVKVVELGPEDVNVPNETGAEIAIYHLTASVVEVKEKEHSHLVSHVSVAHQGRPASWYLFNDFLVQTIPETEARQFKQWKIPAVFQYTRVDVSERVDYSVLPAEDDMFYLRTPIHLNRRKEKDLKINYKSLQADELPKEPGFLCAIDAEFVALSKEETEIRSDGTRSMLRPSRLSLARVSVLRGDGPNAGLPFIDEYISTTEPIVDYLTEFSGIKAGDLDPGQSRHPLVSLKSAYKRLRLLVDLGCVFIGHGLKKDFRIINILVPPEQVIDTVDLFFLQNRQRKLSLRFLAWCLLKEDIQKDTHDSIEDARTALRLHQKYVELQKEGRFAEVLEEVYEEGRMSGFRPPVNPTVAADSGTKMVVAGVNVMELPP
ncbi:poly(A)-specific ribonuclease [Rhizophlyctis rosea]|nr:poly(A)-specific ribonuclease [Rhizophlyctis rosea]